MPQPILYEFCAEISPNPENLVLRLAGIRTLPSFSAPASSGTCSLYNPHLCTLGVVAWSGGQIIGLTSSLPGRRFPESAWNSYSYKQSIPSTLTPINKVHSSTPKYSLRFTKIFLPPIKMICFSENCLWEGYSPPPLKLMPTEILWDPLTQPCFIPSIPAFLLWGQKQNPRLQLLPNMDSTGPVVWAWTGEGRPFPPLPVESAQNHKYPRGLVVYVFLLCFWFTLSYLVQTHWKANESFLAKEFSSIRWRSLSLRPKHWHQKLSAFFPQTKPNQSKTRPIKPKETKAKMATQWLGKTTQGG